MNYPPSSGWMRVAGALVARIATRTLTILAVVAFAWKWAAAPPLGPGMPIQTPAGQPAPQVTPAAPGERPFAVRVSFNPGEKWSGTIAVADARIAEARGWRTGSADQVSVRSFEVDTADPRPRGPTRKGFVLRGSGGSGARISIETGRGVLSFRIWEIALGHEVGYLEERARVERLP